MLPPGSQSSSTGYARLTPRQAKVVLAASIFMGVLCVGVTLSPLAQSNLDVLAGSEGDIALYRAEVERIHAGQSYYEAIAAELVPRGYPTKSVFNWRSPLPVWMLGKMPVVPMGKIVLGLLAMGVVVLGFEAMAREQGHGLGRPLLGGLLLAGAMLPTVLGDLFVSPELWAGVWVALSICLFELRRPYLGVVAGLAAVFFRELAMPYCLIAMLIAWQHQRYRELAAWAVGLTGWAIFYGLHCWQVFDHIALDARAHAHGWVCLGGIAFVISTIQMNFYLILLPQWVAALFFIAAMLGFAGWNTPLGVRCGLTACLFVVAFGFVGQEFNQYWGWLSAPLFCFGVARFPASIHDLWKAAAIKSRREPCPTSRPA